ncbi:MAG: hypothetical protein AAB071_03875 [Bacteroidota bacterium]
MNKNDIENCISKGLTGIAGEYFVAAELSRLGYISTITLKNTKGVDVLATNEQGTKTVAIQVKTNKGIRKKWVLQKKTIKNFGPNFYYVFVNLKDKFSHPDYYIVPSRIVTDKVQQGHTSWLRTPGKKGQTRNDSTIRTFSDENEDYKNKWELLGLGPADSNSKESRDNASDSSGHSGKHE